MQEIRNPYGFIYITTNIIDGKRYIGQRKFDSKGHTAWQNYLGSGTHLKRAVKKYGEDKFKRDIVDIAYTKEELDKKEIQWIADCNAVESKDFYNIAEGGTFKMTEEIKQTISRRTREGMTAEVRKKISKSKQGTHPTNETKSKMSEIQKDLNKSIEHRKKFSKAVVQLSKEGYFIAEFYAGIEAKRQTEINNGHINKCCKGERKTAGGYIWMYAEDYYKQQAVETA